METESIIIYRPDGVAQSYKVGVLPMNQPGESVMGEVTAIEISDSDDGNDYCRITFEKGEKVFGSMQYVYTKNNQN